MWSIFLTNAAVLVAAGVVLAISPATISHPVTVQEIGTVVVGVLLMLAINAFLFRQALRPLERLSALMRRVDPLRPGQRISRDGGPETVELADAFNRMIDRLESERRESAWRALVAQESERRRLAQELHDQVGQSMTALTLQLATIADRAPGELGEELAEARELARSTAEEVRAVVRELRPEALDDLGLPTALTALTERLATHTGLHVEKSLRRVHGLTPEAELVIYRVAQESLTNVIRHSGADRAELRLEQSNGAATLLVSDRGRGIAPEQAEPGQGIRGMRERALLIDAELEISSPIEGGTLVRLAVPVDGAQP